MKFIAVIVSFVGLFAQASDQKAESWVQAADRIRNPSGSYQMRIAVENDGQKSEFEVYLKGQDKTLIVTKEPARDRGRNMLMLDRDFHAYIPNLKRSMKLSLAQKLSGQVANGDISRTRWFGDYDVKFEKSEGQEHQLLLKARKPNLTYEWIRLWLRQSDSRPMRAEYLALNGKTVLKKAFFENDQKLAGALRPSRIRIQDTAGATSSIQILSMKNSEMKDSFFTVRNMETLK